MKNGQRALMTSLQDSFCGQVLSQSLSLRLEEFMTVATLRTMIVRMGVLLITMSICPAIGVAEDLFSDNLLSQSEQIQYCAMYFRSEAPEKCSELVKNGEFSLTANAYQSCYDALKGNTDYPPPSEMKECITFANHKKVQGLFAEFCKDWSHTTGQLTCVKATMNAYFDPTVVQLCKLDNSYNSWHEDSMRNCLDIIKNRTFSNDDKREIWNRCSPEADRTTRNECLSFYDGTPMEPRTGT